MLDFGRGEMLMQVFQSKNKNRPDLLLIEVFKEAMLLIVLIIPLLYLR